MGEPKEKEERNLPMNIYVLQRSDEPGDPNYEARDNTWETVRGEEKWTLLNNIFELKSHVKQKCGAKFYVSVLRIGSHGNSDQFHLANRIINSKSLEELKEYLQEINSYFRRGKSIICIDACEVGQNDLLLKQVSDVFGGIPVIAPFEGQYTNEGVPLLEGAARVCNPTACFTIEHPALAWRI